MLCVIRIFIHDNHILYINESCINISDHSVQIEIKYQVVSEVDDPASDTDS